MGLGFRVGRAYGFQCGQSRSRVGVERLWNRSSILAEWVRVGSRACSEWRVVLLFPGNGKALKLIRKTLPSVVFMFLCFILTVAVLPDDTPYV